MPARESAKPISFVLVLATLLGCSSSAPSRSSQQPPGSDSPKQSAPKTLTIAYPGEPETFAISTGSQGGGTGGANELNLAVTQWLVTYDDRGIPHPMLASELPSRDNGTWIVRPDGTMQTTYRLRSGVTWHDGAAMTARDIVFGVAVIKDPDIPVGKAILDLTDRLEAPDDHTLVIEWTKTYPFAGELADSHFIPLPAHIMELIYRADRERFLQSAFWSREFVGVGPFKVGEWEPGSHLVLNAYDGYYAGRAKIDQIIVRFISDDNAVIANLLSGAVDGEIPRAIELEQATFVRREMERAGKKPLVIVQPEGWRHLFAQFRDPTPREILDVRARRALLHAIDRQGMVNSLLDGQAPVVDTMLAPQDPRWEWVKDVAAKYEYDPRRAQQLLEEVGWRRADGGPLTNAAGERVTIPLWTNAGQATESVIAIIGNEWTSVGISVDQNVIPTVQARDQRYRASFPAFYYGGISATFSNLLSRYNVRACPTEASRWVGTAIGCYQNAELERVVDALQGAIDPADQRRLWRDFVRHTTEELPILPMFFNVVATLFREGVTGIKGHTQPVTHISWNIAEWDVR